MYSSNQTFRINGKSCDDLLTVFETALKLYGNDVTSYHLSCDNGLLFGWVNKEIDGWTPLPSPASARYMMESVTHYLQSKDADTVYQQLLKINACGGDSDVEKGWEVYYPETNDYKGLNLHYAVIAVRPALIYYAK